MKGTFAKYLNKKRYKSKPIHLLTGMGREHDHPHKSEFCSCFCRKSHMTANVQPKLQRWVSRLWSGKLPPFRTDVIYPVTADLWSSWARKDFLHTAKLLLVISSIADEKCPCSVVEAANRGCTYGMSTSTFNKAEVFTLHWEQNIYATTSKSLSSCVNCNSDMHATVI